MKVEGPAGTLYVTIVWKKDTYLGKVQGLGKRQVDPEVTKGNESRPSWKWQPTDDPVYSVGCVGGIDCEFIKLRVNISKTGELLTDSALKGENLIGSTEYQG
jgi:hypothetical protein